MEQRVDPRKLSNDRERVKTKKKRRRRRAMKPWKKLRKFLGSVTRRNGETQSGTEDRGDIYGGDNGTES